MKNLRTLFAAIFMAAGIAVSAQSTITSTDAHVVINGQTSREQLAQLRTDLMAQGIDFQYRPVFDADRHLAALTFTVSANNGALTGSGEHNTLQGPGASLTFDVNKTAGTFTVDAKADAKKK